MNKINIQPVILCGGAGNRLWPLSRAGFPKQFLSFDNSQSLFQNAALRLNSLSNEKIQSSNLVVVTGEDHRFLVLEQLKEVDITLQSTLLEPEGRNTAPALTLTALQATESGEDPILVVTPADQLIDDNNAFQDSIYKAIYQVEQGGISILGITPSKPETGYGYIHTIADHSLTVLNVQQFVEKPDLQTAKRYLNEGGYYWNAGIFVLRASTWLNALGTFRPDILQSSRVAWDERSKDRNTFGNFIRLPKDKIEAIPAESIDYAVIEKCPNHKDFTVYMVELNAGWSDMGSWDAVWDQLPKDESGNAHLGDSLVVDSTNTLIHSSSRLVSVVGVDNLVVIETPDAVMVADKTRSQDVKHIVAKLQQQGREEQTIHRKVYRPWGWYDSVDEGDRFKVKRIKVNPGASLSLQKHFHRAEHWVVVKGTAEVTIGKKVLLFTENKSTFIPLGEVHRLSNPGSISLEIIEVQSGSYLGEDDIVRLQDVYERDLVT